MDDRDFITRSIELSEATNGRRPSPDELAATLLLHAPAKRGAILDQIKAEGQRSEHTVRQAADRLPYERALREAHLQALAVGK
jgi:hypothetical protein